MPSETFGLDIGEKIIKIAQVEPKGDLLEAKAFSFVENLANIYAADTEADLKNSAGLIDKMLKDTNIKKTSVNVVIPDSQSYSQIIEMPELTEKELISAIRYQADQFIPIPIDKVSLDIEIIDHDKQNKKMLILLVAAPNAIIDKVTTITEMAGLEPESIENEASATLRLISFVRAKNQPPEEGGIIFINFGYSSTSLYFVSKKNYLPLQTHNFTLGLDIFIKDVASNLNLETLEVKKLLEAIGFSDQKNEYNIDKVLSSPFDELISKIEKFIVAVKSKFNLPVNKLYLMGEGLKINSLDKKLSTTLGINIELLELYSLFSKNNIVDFFKNDLSLLVPSIGASLR